ncbi:Ger(x)C family spore germination protein [Dethiothermospora halolimnae]|uniref:Ger(x)C family spore germination protein n=1 Tax=Dethiothermospora halolimnae TaxID=3114390 RepID=UPI003CCB9C70
MKRSFKIFIIMILNIALLSGCWNYKEINELQIVTGMAIDKVNDKYKVTFEVIKPKTGKEMDIEPAYITMTDDTILKASRKGILRSGKSLYFSHTKVVIIDSKIAKEGLIPALDLISRDADVRSDMWILISTNTRANEILKSMKDSKEIVSFHIDDMLKSQKSLSIYYAIDLWHFLNDLSEEGISPILPCIGVITRDEEVKPEVIGIDIFKQDKMVGCLNERDSRNLLFIKNKVYGGIVVIPKVNGMDTKISLEIFSNNTKVRPVVKEGTISMKIDVEIDSGIAEIDGSLDVINEKGRKKLKLASEKLIKRDIEETIKKIQKQYGTDVFGFGLKIKKEKPKVWKEIKDQWEEMFSKLPVEIDVKVNIKSSALTSKPIQVGD